MSTGIMEYLNSARLCVKTETTLSQSKSKFKESEMLYPVLDFLSVWYISLLLLVVLICAIFSYTQEFHVVVALVCIYAALNALFVKDVPVPPWWLIVGYFVGATLWIPIFWYLELASNRRLAAEVIERLKPHDISNLGHIDVQRLVSGLHPFASIVDKDGTKSVLPSHPSSGSLVGAGLTWPISAPIYVAEDWINHVINFFRQYMDKVRSHMRIDLN